MKFAVVMIGALVSMNAMAAGLGAESNFFFPGTDIGRVVTTDVVDLGVTADKEVPVVVCDLGRTVADYRLSVTILAGGLAGLTRAKVEESTFAGAIGPESYFVKRTDSEDGTTRAYAEKNSDGTQDFELKIELGKQRDDGRYPAHVTLEMQGQRISEDLACKVMTR